MSPSGDMQLLFIWESNKIDCFCTEHVTWLEFKAKGHVGNPAFPSREEGLLGIRLDSALARSLAHPHLTT